MAPQPQNIVNLQASVAQAVAASAPAAQALQQDAMKIVIVGHVDHGKSTLVGRLLHDTGSLPPEKIEEVKAVSAKRGLATEWAFLLDSFQAERDQGVTIDITQIRFKSAARNYLIIDAPGHKEFLKNMITGAASADAAVLVIDAGEGVREQSRRHGYLLHLLGIRQVMVVVNKMDLVKYDHAAFNTVEREISAYLTGLGVVPTFIVPVSARDGECIVSRSDKMPWYDGPDVLAALDRFTASRPPRHLPLRFPVQDVLKLDHRRIVVGRIESGVLRVGDKIMFSPSNKTAFVKTIESWNEPEPPVQAEAGECIGITLDEQIFVERGEVISHVDTPPQETNVFNAHIFWLGDKPLEAGRQYAIKLATNRATVTVQSIEKVIDANSLGATGGDKVERHGVAEVVLRSRGMLALDEFGANPALGRFVVIDEYDIVGGGIIHMKGYPDQRDILTVRSSNITPVTHRVTPDQRRDQNGHAAGVIWLTGLSGAGKSTIALEVERKLFELGYHVYLLDGDNVRTGLNANLGFSPEDRAENIRRVGEVSALMADAGFIVISSFISPYRSDRQRARDAAKDRFHEIYVHADLATCESRDPKGLYKKARRGEIPDFTGISAPYELPETPDLILDTVNNNADWCVNRLVEYVKTKLGALD